MSFKNDIDPVSAYLMIFLGLVVLMSFKNDIGPGIVVFMVLYYLVPFLIKVFIWWFKFFITLAKHMIAPREQQLLRNQKYQQKKESFHSKFRSF